MSLKGDCGVVPDIIQIQRPVVGGRFSLVGYYL
jgi:hypothetical protein